ncbi:unnamed protein product [Alternaria alternata]
MAGLQKKIEAQEATLQELKQLRNDLSDRTRRAQEPRRQSPTPTIEHHAVWSERTSVMMSLRTYARRRLNEQRSQVDALQRLLAEERLEALEELRENARREKDDFEAEIEVLQEDADEVAEEKASLERGELTVLESMIREKESQNGKLYNLKSRAAQREQKAALENTIRDLESRIRDKDAQHRKLLSEAKSATRNQQSALEHQLQDLQSHLREKESQLRLIQASSKAIQQKANQDAIDLDEQAETLTKRHIKEINGLAKQIQFLRARCSRAEAFREALGYQKKFFLMQIQTYNECNQEDLNLISQMGITPDITVHNHRPKLKSAIIAVVAAIRMQKLADGWAQNRKIHEQLKAKLESMRRNSGRNVGVPTSARKSVGGSHLRIAR